MWFRPVLPLVLAAVLPAWGQLYFFEGDIGRAAPPPAKPLMADVTTTLTAQTPWGPFNQSETGKYWRSRDGKIRQDTAYGLSDVVDLGSLPRSMAHIDYELRRISVSIGRTDLGQPSEDVTGRDFNIGNNTTRAKKSGEAVLDGFKVTIRKGEFRHEGKSNLQYEIWTADDLKIILLFKLKSDSAELVQRYRNIRLEEPDPSIFQLPPGFRSVTNYPRSASSLCMRQEVGISGEPRPTEVNSVFCQP
jgi:hypothetical protein